MKHSHEEYAAFVNERIARKQAQIKDVERYEGGSLADLIYDEQPLPKWGVELKELGEDIASLLANEATLERHEPIPDKDGLRSLCKFCADGMWAVKAPCPTYTGVTDQLDLVMEARG